jgi:hypothetical protein
MISPHTMSSFKSHRLEPSTKASIFRSLATSRVDRNSYIQPRQSRMPESHSIIEQFRIYRESHSLINLEAEMNEDEKNSRRRISYTRKQKLETISYATII